MDILLIAGLWLKENVWDDVVDGLRRGGHRAIPVSLPGVDDDPSDASLEDQIAAVVAAVDAAEQPLVVGHSAACTLAWIAADRRPDAVAKVVMIGGFPAEDGDTYASFFEVVGGVMAFPGWEPFEGADSADLDEKARESIAAGAVAVPGGVAKGVVGLRDDSRYAVPVHLVCPEFSPKQAKAWIDGGEVPELEKAKDVSFTDIDSGHWPMFSKPEELAQILSDIASGLRNGFSSR